MPDDHQTTSDFAAVLAQLAASAQTLFPRGVEELSLTCGEGAERVELRVRAARGTTVPTGRGGESVDPATIEGTPEFRLRWNISGHRVIAHLAMDILRDRKSPVVPALEALLTAGADENRDAELGSYAAWPDVMKKSKPFKDRTSKWHYIDIAWDGSSDEPPVIPAGENVLTAMGVQSDVLANASDVRERADALAFVAHFVGDIHQPLHCIELHNAQFPNGDAGGNKFTLAHGSNMHSLWDGFVASNKADIVSSAGKLTQQFPAAMFTARLAKTDVRDWILETHALGRDAYREILAEDVDVRASEEYRSWGRRVSREQAALGAYRLADLLERLLKP